MILHVKSSNFVMTRGKKCGRYLSPSFIFNFINFFRFILFQECQARVQVKYSEYIKHTNIKYLCIQVGYINYMNKT